MEDCDVCGKSGKNIENFNPCAVTGQVKSLIHDYDQK